MLSGIDLEMDKRWIKEKDLYTSSNQRLNLEEHVQQQQKVSLSAPLLTDQISIFKL